MNWVGECPLGSVHWEGTAEGLQLLAQSLQFLVVAGGAATPGNFPVCWEGNCRMHNRIFMLPAAVLCLSESLHFGKGIMLLQKSRQEKGNKEPLIKICAYGAMMSPCLNSLTYHLPGVALTDSDFWFPVSLQQENAMPSRLRGHTATYDPDTKRIYIFGGIREDKDYSGIYILDTVTWKWLLVAVSTTALLR